MNKIIEINSDQQLIISYNTESDTDKLILDHYYELTKTTPIKWAHTVNKIKEAFKINGKELLKLAKEKATVKWVWGPCSNKSKTECSEILVFDEMNTRTDLSQILSGRKRPPHYHSRNSEKTIHQEVLSSWKKPSHFYQNEYRLLCDSCLDSLLYQAYCEEIEERLQNEAEEIIATQNVKIFEDKIKLSIPSTEYISSGFPDVDRSLYKGFETNKLHIIASNPPEQARCFLLSVVNSFIEKNIKAAFITDGVSISNTKKQLLRNKIDCTEEQFDNLSTLVKEGKANKLEEGLQIINANSVEIINSSQRGISAINEIKRLSLDKGIKIFVLDSLQTSLIPRVSDREGNINQENYFSDNIRNLSDFIQESQVTIIARSILNRDISDRIKYSSLKNRFIAQIPIATDLRDSSVIEEKAHSILFLHSQGYYANNPSELDYEVEFRIEKLGALIRPNHRFCKLEYHSKTGFFYSKQNISNFFTGRPKWDGNEAYWEFD